MKKFYKFLKSFLFISLWLILSSFLTQYWNTFHWEYICLNFRIIFDKEFWFVVEKILLGFDIGAYVFNIPTARGLMWASGIFTTLLLYKEGLTQLI